MRNAVFYYNLIMDIFVTRLNKLLNETGVSKYRLGKDLKVSNQTVLWWCNGTNEPKITHLKNIALYFDVTTDYLVGLENENGTKIR